MLYQQMNLIHEVLKLTNRYYTDLNSLCNISTCFSNDSGHVNYPPCHGGVFLFDKVFAKLADIISWCDEYESSKIKKLPDLVFHIAIDSTQQNP